MVEDAERKSRKLHGAEKKDSVDPSRSLETTPKTNDLPSPSSFNEESSVTAAALLNLVRLLGGELVLVRGLEVGKFEHAVRERLGQFVSPPVNPAVRKAGIARARHLVEQVLTQIRAQAEVKSSLTVAKSQERNSLTSAPSPAKALN
jgi:hypothetical protein